MVKKILSKSNNRQYSMNKTHRMLTTEGINIKAFDVYNGVLETEHVYVRFINNEHYLRGLTDYDIAFNFEPTDNIQYHLKPFPDTYSGTLIGYIVKTEAEETLKEEQEKLKRQQRLLLNSTYGRFGTLLPDSDYSKEFVNYGDIVAEGFTAGICKRDDSIVAKLDAVAIAKAALEKNAIGHLKTFKFKPIIQSIKPYIDKVVFNDPATIIFWTDDTKTVVKAEGEAFDPEKGLAMAIAKKALGNKHDYYNIFKKYLKKYKPSEDAPIDAFYEFKVSDFSKGISDIQKKVYESFGLVKDTRYESVQKAYNSLVAYRDATAIIAEKQISPDRDVMLDLDEIIGYLGEALKED